MKNLYRKRSLRVLSFILFVVFLFLTMAACAVFRYGLRDGWYRNITDPVSFVDTTACRQYVDDALIYVETNMRAEDDYTLEGLGAYAGAAFSYVMTDGIKILADTRTPNSILVTQFDVFDSDQRLVGTLMGYVNLPVEPYSGCYSEYYIFHLLCGYRFLIAVLMVVFAALTAFMFIFAVESTAVSGRMGTLSRFFQIPADVFILGCFAAWIISSIGMISIMDRVRYMLAQYFSDGANRLLAYFSFAVPCAAVLALLAACMLSGQHGAGMLRRRTLILRIMRRMPFIWWAVSGLGIHLLFCCFIFLACRNTGELVLIAIDIVLLPLLVIFALEEQKLQKAMEKLAKGDLDHKIEANRLHYIWRMMAESLNSISDGMSAAVEEQMKSERMKTELITNVSHDLKTPLTSIVSYIDLLKDKSLPQETREEYLAVLERQSDKLRKLTEDVVEASKAASGVIPVNAEKLDAGELLRQCVGEYAERLKQAGIEPVMELPEQSVFILADGQLICRVLENFMTNIVKYTQTGTRVYFDLTADGNDVVLSLKNISRDPLNISPEELIERFVRGDSSRHSEGSGLGLSIAKSLTELMGGRMELVLDGDLFKVQLLFKQV